MQNKLIEMVNQGKYDEAWMELEQYDTSEYTEELAIVAVSALLGMGRYEKAQKYLELGLQINAQSDELYLLLGNYYERYNLMQAYLCYENAKWYCQDAQDREIIQSFQQRVEEKMCEGGGKMQENIYYPFVFACLGYNQALCGKHS